MIKIEKVSLSFITKEVVELIRQSLWQLVQVDSNELGTCWCKFIRIHVNINIMKPLTPGYETAVRGGEAIWPLVVI